MQVSVHKGIELMTVVWQICDSEFKEKHFDMFCGDPSYVAKIHEWFDKFKDEEVIHKFLELKFNFGAISWGCVLDDVYNLTVEANETMKDFFKLLSKFAKKIKFDDFFEENKTYYQTICESYNKFLEKSEYESFMKWFYKKDCTLDKERKFILLPSLFQLGMCLQNGKVCCASVQEIDENGCVYFLSKEARAHFIPHTAIHEFSHPIINPLTKQYFANHDKFFIDSEGTLNAGIYKDEDVINDTIIEAILALYLEMRGLNKFRGKRLKVREGVGYYLVEPLSQFLKEYTNNIEKYNSFSEFFPQVMEFLKENLKK